MKCPHCGAPTRVLSTRKGTVRRRECFNNHRFTTQEALHNQGELNVATSRKTYIAVAAAIKNARAVPCYVPGDPPEVQKACDAIAKDLVRAFQADNPAFDPQRFLRAAGVNN